MTLCRHYVATAYVYDGDTDRFLLIHHKKLGRWLPPGGHLHEGEEPHQGALRELFEETGMEGRIIDLLPEPEVDTPAAKQLPAPFCLLSEIIPAGSKDEEHIHIDFVYVVAVDPAAPLNVCVKEVTLARWISADTIASIDTYENTKQVCRSISQRARLLEKTPRVLARDSPPGAKNNLVSRLL